jgi:hypothetical protein
MGRQFGRALTVKAHFGGDAIKTNGALSTFAWSEQSMQGGVSLSQQHLRHNHSRTERDKLLQSIKNLKYRVCIHIVV